MHRFYIVNNQVQDGTIHLTGEDVNHIKNVLRMRIGEKAILCNQEGKDYYCSVLDIRSDSVIFSIEEEKNSDTELKGKIFLFQGLPKKDKMELIIQKAVELGVYEIIPVMTSRTIVKLEDAKKEQKKLERWQAISVSAAKQSGRGIIPRVTEVYSFKEALEYANKLDKKLLPYENEKGMLFTREVIDQINPADSVGVFIGPEGGFEEREVQEASKYGFIPITLGKRILRTETAGLTALSLLMFKMESGI